MKDQTIGGGCPSRHSDRHLSRIRVGGGRLRAGP
jgi:hypothetical protein